jgi:cytosine/adenosine deaminase-related metal-dependent hydrolase
VKQPTTDDFFEVAAQLHDEYSGHPRITIMLAPIGPQWVSDDVLVRIREKASEWGMAIHIHCLESPYQREFGRRTYGRSTVGHLHEMEFLGTDVSLGHAVWLTDEDLDICADTGTSIVHNASSNLRLRSGILPLAHVLNKGINVSIGMDGLALNDDEDMLQELRLVSQIHRLPRGLEYQSCPNSFDVLAMATVNGARTLMMDTQVGTLEPGKKADAVLIDTTAATHPYLDPSVHILDALVYRARGTDVDTVVIDGEVVYRDREFVNVDESEILSDLVRSAQAPLEAPTQRWFDLVNELRPYVVGFYERWESPTYQPYYSTNSML